MSTQVVTRFAPSPTGFLHIGGARTALFNWLFARHHGGKMLLRIEDTDRTRSTDAAIDAILDGLNWLEIDWDEEPIYQFSRVDRHKQVAEQLLATGRAYRCYASKEELDEMREQARAEGRPPRYDGRWRDRDPSQAPEGVEPVIRLRTPQDGETVVDDHVQGRVVFQNKEFDDLIILRSDGTPTYMLAVVVDDHDMGVTHVIRGDDHFTNSARQALIYQLLDWPVPEMAHVPLIHGPDGAKLSKRHGALGVDAYRAMGYVPAALRNYLARLGWSHGDEEIFSTKQMIEWFGLEAIGKSAARFDFAKLEALNGHYVRSGEDTNLVGALEAVVPYLDRTDLPQTPFDNDLKSKLTSAMPGLKERAKTLVELIESAAYIYNQRPLELDQKATTILSADARTTLSMLLPDLNALSEANWSAETTETTVKAFAERNQLKLGKVAQPLRAALTGKGTSPGIFDVLQVLGREESLARIRDQATILA